MRKLRHHSPPRKSPRLISSSAQLKPKAEPKSETRPEDAWALSLHVVSPTPLEICHPSQEEEEDKSPPRRSSRFTTNKYKTPTSKISRSRIKACSALVVAELRRSPRFPSSAPALTSTDGENLGSRKRRRLGENEIGKEGKIYSDGKNLRRSSRLSVDSSTQFSPFPELGSKSVNKGSLRRGGGGGSGNSSPQLLALPAPESQAFSKGSLSEKRLRSRTVLMQVGNRTGSSSPQLLALPALESQALSKGSSSENCLRSRTVSMQVGNQAGNSSSQLLALPAPESGALSKGSSSEKSLRSRTVSMHVENQTGNSSPQLLALPAPESKSLSERCLRSRTVLMHVGHEKAESDKISTKKNSGDLSTNEKGSSKRVNNRALSKSPEASDSRDVRSASGVKCLKSKTVSKQVQDEKEKPDEKSSTSDDLSIIEEGLKFSVNNYALVESPEASENREVMGASSENFLRAGTPEKELEKESVERGISGATPNEKSLLSPKIESVLDELFGDSESWEEENCDLELSSEKCLRSRKIQCRVGTDEIAEGSNAKNTVKSEKKVKGSVGFIGDPIPEEEAQKRWEWRYELKNKKKGKGWKLNADEEDEIILNVDCHYAQARIGNCILSLGDCVYVKGEGKKKHVGRILEFFKTMEGEDYFRVQWFFRAEDTVLKDAASLHDKRRLFYSTLMNDNLLDCIISKVNIVRIPPMLCLKSNPIQSAAFYYDMEYCVEYSTFRSLPTETSTDNQTLLSNSKHFDEKPVSLTPLVILPNHEPSKEELSLLDLFSGCGGMSTGLCAGAKLSSINLVTKWAVDCNSSACDSLRVNHPETHVRNESTDDFLELLRQWEELCKLYVCDIERTVKCELEDPPEAEDCSIESIQSETEESSAEYEVSHLVDICYGDPTESGKRGLHFKVRWKGYGPDDDTWEPSEGLSNCQERIQEFVREGFKSKLLPLPGEADVICGGPPCQGISGYNRHRNYESPLADERNRQIIVFMDIVEFLKPKYILMENVVDIIRFDKASLARYALSRLVHMKYQSRLGTIASGCYGLPQFRLRVFIWGAHPTQTLPQFPLPTHDVIVRYWPPLEFERNIVAYDEGQTRFLEKPIILQDSISDLPAVTNEESREEMAYEKLPETEFQTCIRYTADEMTGPVTEPSVLYDHRPLRLSEHDYLRVCQVPHRKGANFRDLPGIMVGADNVARRDPTKEPVMLPTGKPLVPDCVLSFEQGKSKRPYARVWWDETVSTVVTFPHVRAQAILHPEQDRVLTIRECARLQGFPDVYRFCGTIKERYCQVGNAVSVPVARALGYVLGMAYKKEAGDEPLMTLPPKFSLLRASGAEGAVLGS